MTIFEMQIQALKTCKDDKALLLMPLPKSVLPHYQLFSSSPFVLFLSHSNGVETANQVVQDRERSLPPFHASQHLLMGEAKWPWNRDWPLAHPHLTGYISHLAVTLLPPPPPAF